MYAYYTTSGSKNVAISGRKLTIQVNAALTGTITVGAAGATIAVITNPTVGSRFEYWDLVGQITVNPSATCDITVGVDGSRGPK